MRDLARLFRPKTIAVIGGGAWGRAVISQCRKMKFPGEIWHVHPTAAPSDGLKVFSRISDLPFGPDASFVGVNRFKTINIVRELATISSGGAVCFASGYSEASAEDPDATALQSALRDAAGDMPILGPNCYGFINYLDGALLWPDQHGGEPVDTGVALITQSSNIAINLTMQMRALPLAYVVTAGNQAQTGLADIGIALLNDPRVTALGLHVEGISDLRSFEALSQCARRLKKPIVALKVGKSAQARAGAVSHTASLAGADAGAQALLDRLGIARVDTLSGLLEALKILHLYGPLTSNRIASISCSGGEASLAADAAVGRDLVFPPLNGIQKQNLRTALGPMVALANPLDYHTYIWRDADAMTAAWSAMADASLALICLIVDFPRDDRCDVHDWECAITAALNMRKVTGANVAVVSTLPELMPETTAKRLMAGGVVPICGLPEAIAAAEAAARCGHAALRAAPMPLVLPGLPKTAAVISERQAKTMLAAYGVPVPVGQSAVSLAEAASIAAKIGYPIVLKSEGGAHKSEAGGVILNIQSKDALLRAFQTLPAGPVLVEKMQAGASGELLVGVIRDPAHGFLMTLAAGGIFTELMNDKVSMLVPTDADAVRSALENLQIGKVLLGYRGRPAADFSKIISAIMAIQNYVVAHAEKLEEIEINPLICGPDGAVAADALLRQDLS